MLLYMNTWCPVGRTINEGLEDMTLFKGSVSLGTEIGFWKLLPGPDSVSVHQAYVSSVSYNFRPSPSACCNDSHHDDHGLTSETIILQ